MKRRLYLLLDEPLLLPVEPLLPDEPLAPVEPLVPEEPLELGELLELEPEPMLLPVLDELPPDAPVLLEPDLLKWASHSERETWPSLFLSTDEKLGAEELPLDEEPPAEAEPDADGEDDEDEDGLDDEEPPVAALPLLLESVADGEDEDDDGLDAEGLDEDEDDCATANVDRANMTAAAVMLRRMGIEVSPEGGRRTTRGPPQALCPFSRFRNYFCTRSGGELARTNRAARG